VSRDSSQKRDEFWVSLVEFCRKPSATNGRMLLEEQFREGWLYASLAKAQLQPSEIASAVGNFGKYLKHRKDNPKNYSSEDALDFACHCPLCRGEAGVHYIRVFDLACNLYAAVYTVRQATEHNRDLLHEPITDYFHKAVRFLRQGAEKLTSISWKATDPLRDLLHQYAARYPDPAMNLIDELLHYFLHGQWRPSQRGVAATFPLAFQNGGAIAKLVLERTDALVSGFYPHPKLLLATRWDEAFAEQFACAWAHHATDRNATLRWSLEPYRSEGTVWKGVAITGPSIGAAVGVALKCIENPNQPPPDIDCALTGKLEPNGSLGNVGGYRGKSTLFVKYPNLRLIYPCCDAEVVQDEIPDYLDRLIPVDTLEQALQHAIELPDAVRAYLEQLIEKLDNTPWYYNGQQISPQEHFIPSRVLVEKLPAVRPEQPVREQSRPEESDRGFAAHIRRMFGRARPRSTHQQAELQPQETPGNPREELQSELYDLPHTSHQRLQKLEMSWSDFTKRIYEDSARVNSEKRKELKRFALIGSPGSGKTFSTRHLAIKTAQQALQDLNEGKPLDEICIPFWLPAAKLGETGNLRDAIAELLPSLPRAWLDNILDNILEKGSFLLVIDALDELRVSQQAKFQTCVQRIGVQQGEGQQDDGKVGVQQGEDQQEDGKVDIQQGDGKKRIVLVTCRTMHWEERSRWLGWEKLPDAVELAPLELREQRLFIEKFFSAEISQAQSLQKRLRENYVLQHACRTPLLLTFACLLHGENLLRSDLTYAELYAHILRRLIRGTWRNLAEPLAASEVDEEPAMRQLETIAWNLFRQSPERNLFTLDEWRSAESRVSPASLDPDELLKKLERVGVVVFAGYDGRGDSQWSFAHRSILEFLAARCLSRQPNWLDEISQHFWFQPEWVEVLTFLAGLVENADPLVERLEQEQDDIFGSMLLLQARVVGFGKVSETLAQRVAERAVKWYLRARVPNQFTLPILQAIGRHAVQPLCNVIEQANHAPRMVRILQKIPLLEDRRRKTLAAACEALEVIGHPAAVDTLRSILTSEEDFEIVRQAIRALCAIGDRSAVRALIQEMQNRGFAAYQPTEEWSKLGTVEAIEELTKILGTANQPWILAEICRILGAVGSHKSVDALIDALHNPEAQVRSAACYALGAIGSDKAVDPLIRALDDPEVEVRRGACYALGAIGGDRAADALLQALDREEDSGVRARIYEALGKTGYAKSIDKLVDRGLREPEDWVYSEACKALGKLLPLSELDQRRQELAVTALIEASQNGHPRFRLEAAKVLVEIGNPHAAEVLENILREVQRTIRKEVFAVLERGKWTSRSFRELCREMKYYNNFSFSFIGENIRICSEARELLATIGSQLSVQTLIDSLRSDFDLFLEVACRVLGVDTIQGSRLIQQAIQEEDKRIRRRARRELKKINRDSERILTYAASTFSWYKSLVDATRGSLSIITKPEAVPTLVDALESNDAYIELVVSICDTLGAIGDERAVDALIQRAKHSENVGVRKAACHALGAIGTPEAIQTLMEIALRGDRSTCWAAFVAIYKAGAGRGYNYIASLLRVGRGEPQDEKLTRFLLGCAQYQISALERLRAIGSRSAIRHLLFIGDDHETQIEAYVTAVEICFKDIKPKESRNSQNCKVLASFLFTFFPYWALTDRPLLWNLLFAVCAFFKSRLTHSRFFQISLLKKLFSEFVIKVINIPSFITDIVSLFSARFRLRVSQRANPSGSLLDNWMWLWMVPPLGIRIISSLHVGVVTLFFRYFIILTLPFLLPLAMCCGFISPKLAIYLFIAFAIMSISFLAYSVIGLFLVIGSMLTRRIVRLSLPLLIVYILSILFFERILDAFKAQLLQMYILRI
jgi:HEAT repeat protein